MVRVAELHPDDPLDELEDRLDSYLLRHGNHSKETLGLFDFLEPRDDLDQSGSAQRRPLQRRGSSLKDLILVI